MAFGISAGSNESSLSKLNKRFKLRNVSSILQFPPDDKRLFASCVAQTSIANCFVESNFARAFVRKQLSLIVKYTGQRVYFFDPLLQKKKDK